MPIHGIFSPLHGDTAGEFQFAVGKPLEHTPRLAVLAEAEYDAKEQWEPGGHKLLVDQAFFPDWPMAFPVWLAR